MNVNLAGTRVRLVFLSAQHIKNDLDSENEGRMKEVQGEKTMSICP